METEWLRPFAVTGEIDYDVPTVPSVYTNGILIQQNPTTVDYGFTVQYSLQYMNAYVQEMISGDSQAPRFRHRGTNDYPCFEHRPLDDQ